MNWIVVSDLFLMSLKNVIIKLIQKMNVMSADKQHVHFIFTTDQEHKFLDRETGFCIPSRKIRGIAKLLSHKF